MIFYQCFFFLWGIDDFFSLSCSSIITIDEQINGYKFIYFGAKCINNCTVERSLMNHITDLIRRLRILYLLSPKQLALLLNISVHTYKAIEDGLFSVSPEIVVMLSQIYRIPLEYFKMDSSEDIVPQIYISNEYKTMDEQERFLAVSSNLVGVSAEKDLTRRIRNKKRQILLEIQSNPSVGSVFIGSQDQIEILAKLSSI